jgi:hypothetical protein
MNSCFACGSRLRGGAHIIAMLRNAVLPVILTADPVLVAQHILFDIQAF